MKRATGSMRGIAALLVVVVAPAFLLPASCGEAAGIPEARALIAAAVEATERFARDGQAAGDSAAAATALSGYCDAIEAFSKDLAELVKLHPALSADEVPKELEEPMARLERATSSQAVVAALERIGEFMDDEAVMAAFERFMRLK